MIQTKTWVDTGVAVLLLLIITVLVTSIIIPQSVKLREFKKLNVALSTQLAVTEDIKMVEMNEYKAKVNKEIANAFVADMEAVYRELEITKYQLTQCESYVNRSTL